MRAGGNRQETDLEGKHSRAVVVCKKLSMKNRKAQIL